MNKRYLLRSSDEPRKFEPAMIAPATTEAFDCVSCGACCAPPKDGSLFLDGWTDVQPEDVARLSRQEFAEGVIKRACDNGYVEGDAGPFFVRCLNHEEDGMRCVFLAGKIGEKAPCRIYHRRPDTCAVFKMGSLSCLSARRAAKLPVDEDQVIVTTKPLTRAEAEKL